MRLALSAQSVPDWYPKVDDAVAMFVNHEGEEEEVEVGGTYDAPLTVTFMACPIDTAEYDVLYQWEVTQIKGNKEILLVKRNVTVISIRFSSKPTIQLS